MLFICVGNPFCIDNADVNSIPTQNKPFKKHAFLKDTICHRVRFKTMLECSVFLLPIFSS